MLLDTKVVDVTTQDAYAIILRNLNIKLANDSRISYSLLNVGDGTGLAFKLWENIYIGIDNLNIHVFQV